MRALLSLVLFTLGLLFLTVLLVYYLVLKDPDIEPSETKTSTNAEQSTEEYLRVERFKRSKSQIDQKDILFRVQRLRSRPDIQKLSQEAIVYFEKDEFEAGLTSLEKITKIVEDATGPDEYVLAMFLVELAQIYEVNEKMEQAEKTLLRSVNIAKKHYGPKYEEHFPYAYVLNYLAEFRFNTQAYEEAQVHFEKVLEITKAFHGPYYYDTGRILIMLGRVSEAKNELEASQEYYRKAAKRYELLTDLDEARGDPVSGPDVFEPYVEALYRLSFLIEVQFYFESQNADVEHLWTESVELNKRALHIAKTHLGPDHTYAQQLSENGNLDLETP